MDNDKNHLLVYAYERYEVKIETDRSWLEFILAMVASLVGVACVPMGASALIAFFHPFNCFYEALGLPVILGYWGEFWMIATFVVGGAIILRSYHFAAEK